MSTQPPSDKRPEALRSSFVSAFRVDGMKLPEYEQWLSLAVDPALLGVWINDLQNNTIHATDNWYVLLDIPRRPGLQLADVVDRIHADDRVAFLQARLAALNQGGTYAADVRVPLADGRLRWIASRGHAELNAQGQPVVMRGVSIDITDRKQIEQESRQRLRDLTHMARVSMMGGLSGAMAHELNQPLTAILSNAQAAQRFLAVEKVNLDEIRSILQDIVSEDRRAGEVIRRLRMLLSPTETQREAVDVNELMSETFKLLRSHLVNQQVIVQIEMAAVLPVIHADRVQLQQVLINLVMNACDALRVVAVPDRKLLARTRLDPNQICVTITDKGCGVPEALFNRLFESFATSKPGGMGLGLSVCKSILLAHGGDIWADKPEGRGASFHFTLPLQPVQDIQ
jgi:C4-dicarboxylate-specific signal transduction histidine kinase